MPEKPGPKPRPGLIRAVAVSKDGTRGAIEVTYGTSKYGPDEKPHDLHIINMAELNACGLPRPTCFVLERTLWMPWCAEYFTEREDGTGPVIGKLPDIVLMQLEALKVQRRKAGFRR